MTVRPQCVAYSVSTSSLQLAACVYLLLLLAHTRDTLLAVLSSEAEGEG